MPYECIIAPQIKRQKKTNKYRVINWIYKKLYGYKYESIIQSDVMMFDGKLMFKDKEIYDRVKDSIMNESGIL